MNTLTAGAPSRRKPDPQRQRNVGDTPQKDIVYISSHATAEQKMIQEIIYKFFGRAVYGFVWDESDLRESLGKYHPCCIIVSPGIECKPDSMESVWGIVQQAHSAVPVIWLADDDDGEPYFLGIDNSPERTIRVIIDEGISRTAGKLMKSIAEIIGVQPSFESILK